MQKEKNLGEFEILVLAALIRIGNDAYGVSIRQEIEKRTTRNITVGAMYATLSRLEQKHFLSSTMGEATAERGGRAKRYYKITTLGQTHLKKSISALNNMLDGIESWQKPFSE